MLQTSLLLVKSLNKTYIVGSHFLSVICFSFPKAIIFTFISLYIQKDCCNTDFLEQFKRFTVVTKR